MYPNKDVDLEMKRLGESVAKVLELLHQRDMNEEDDINAMVHLRGAISSVQHVEHFLLRRKKRLAG